jgi:hypothetical protein
VKHRYQHEGNLAEGPFPFFKIWSELRVILAALGALALSSHYAKLHSFGKPATPSFVAVCIHTKKL